MEDEGLLCSFLSTNDELKNFIYDFALVNRLADDFAILQVRSLIVYYYL